MSPQELIKKTLVILDTETTGLFAHRGDEVIELAAEKLVNGNVVDTFHAYLRPTISVPAEATAIHGLTEEFLFNNGEAGEAVFAKFSDFIIDAVLIGHNVKRFDYPFILKHFNRHNIVVPNNSLLDTLDLARANLRLQNYKLSTVAKHFGIATDGAHRADRDVEITRQVFLKLIKVKQ